MVKSIAVQQPAKRGLTHSPYVTCFSSASAARVCYQSAPAEGLRVLTRSHLTMPPVFCSYLSVQSFFTHILCPARVTCHIDVIADERMLMHVESMDAQHTQTLWAHRNKTPTYSYVSCAVTLQTVPFLSASTLS